ncbi:MAG: glycerol-3-phosphate dehydrogenase/oxidase [Bacteroidia bacterium]|nr:glycerol-3-phosphate dehydrogenase/oxidase [Bacteroidia bacterium]
MDERGGKAIENVEFDVLVVGGGATGVGVAYDAALRGLRTALFESRDFASGASGASTKLLHGGVRYLEKAIFERDYGQYRLVKQALRERDAWIAQAPHLARYIPILIPAYSRFQRWYFRAGMRVYDAIAGTSRTTVLNADQAPGRFPALARALAGKPLRGGVIYFDGQFHDARMAVCVAKAARDAGALLFNYAEATDFDFDRKRWHVRIHDKVLDGSYVVRAKTLVNATGPYADVVRRKVSGFSPRLKPSKGVHFFTDKIQISTGLLIPQTSDGRVVFCLPWEGATMVGTTDEFADPTDNRVQEREIEYLLQQINPYLRQKLTPQDVTGTMVGYRPLVLKSATARSEALIRDHEIEVDAKNKAVHVLGGKWTTFRLMAQEAVDRLFLLLDRPFVPCRTLGRTLNDAIEPESFFRLVSRYRFLPEPTRIHLLRYGKDFEKVLDFAAKDGYAPLIEGKPFLAAEYEYALRFEWVVKEEDFYFRRLSVGLTEGLKRPTAIPAG